MIHDTNCRRRTNTPISLRSVTCFCLSSLSTTWEVVVNFPFGLLDTAKEDRTDPLHWERTYSSYPRRGHLGDTASHNQHCHRPLTSAEPPHVGDCLHVAYLVHLRRVWPRPPPRLSSRPSLSTRSTRYPCTLESIGNCPANPKPQGTTDTFLYLLECTTLHQSPT